MDTTKQINIKYLTYYFYNDDIDDWQNIIQRHGCF